ncbi:MAG: helix-turn-helix domain-containing protein [Anaerovoracaceae bacterium]|jgi:transcriptional regulator with XRE-family HTH domain
MNSKSEFASWLELQFINWMRERGEVTTQREFAEYLGLDQVQLSHYINERRKKPDKASLEKIAAKLGPEIYDVLGLARPDPQLKQLTAVWHLLSQDQIRRILAIAFENNHTTSVPTDD